MSNYYTPDQFIAIDFETNGSEGQDVYPLELAIATHLGRKISVKIKPHESWKNKRWSKSAEVAHKISQADLEEKGYDVRRVARFLNSLTRHGKTLVSDNGLDTTAYRMVFKAAAEFSRKDVAQLDDLFHKDDNTLTQVYNRVKAARDPKTLHDPKEDAAFVMDVLKACNAQLESEMRAAPRFGLC